MRKLITKEVTFTSCKLSTMEIVDGTPQAKELGSEKFLGKLSKKKLEKEINKVYKEKVFIYDIELTTVVYEMAIEDFIENAILREVKNNGE